MLHRALKLQRLQDSAASRTVGLLQQVSVVKIEEIMQTVQMDLRKMLFSVVTKDTLV